MAKLTLSDFSNLSSESAAIAKLNENSALIEAALENTLSRDGTAPNSMGADLDMDSNDILNVGNIDVQSLSSGGFLVDIEGIYTDIEDLKADDSVTEPRLDIDNEPTHGYVLTYKESGRMSWELLAGTGDMLVSIYDPTGVVGDAFDMDNMADGTSLVAMTVAEREKLATVEANADVTDATNVTAAGAVMDDDFSSNGLMKRTGAGAYTVVTDGSTNWDTAYGWGDHSSEGYLTSITGENLGDLADVSSAAPTSGDVLTWDGAQWEPAAPSGGGGGGGGGTLLAILEERQTLNTAGGTASVGNNDRVLNTEVYDAGSYASISSGNFTVTEDCWCDFITASYRTAITKAWIYCVTDSVIINGSETVNVHSSPSSPNGGVPASGGCRLKSGKTYRVVMSCSTSQTINGRGIAANAGGYESFTQVHLWSLA